MGHCETETASWIWKVIGMLAVGGFGGLIVPLFKDWLIIKKIKYEYLDNGYSGKHLIKITNDNSFVASIHDISLQFLSDGKIKHEEHWDEVRDSGDSAFYISCANETGDKSLIRHVFHIESHSVYPLLLELDSGKMLGLLPKVRGEKGYDLRLRFKSNVRNGIFRLRRRREYAIKLPTRTKQT